MRHIQAMAVADLLASFIETERDVAESSTTSGCSVRGLRKGIHGVLDDVVHLATRQSLTLTRSRQKQREKGRCSDLTRAMRCGDAGSGRQTGPCRKTRGQAGKEALDVPPRRLEIQGTVQSEHLRLRPHRQNPFSGSRTRC